MNIYKKQKYKKTNNNNNNKNNNNNNNNNNNKVLSDNYPERLRKLVIFPFPWYGRAIWGVVKMVKTKIIIIIIINTNHNN